MSTYPDLHLYINGEWRKTARDLPVINPATEEEIGRLPHAGSGFGARRLLSSEQVSW
jgi:succinate-semialdehyde dehydrogenase/glutarate-semialdehyde dehydrogenase